MIDFSKRMNKKIRNKVVEPLELYELLDRMSETGPLRPIQKKVLSYWNEKRRADKDLIIKLHTGSGKTLIGLLMALSYMYEDDLPSIYVCPNIYLMQQTCEEARKFGIPFCIITPEVNILPDEFIKCKKVLITYVQKLFNGLSIFGLDKKSINVGAIILDDSHACIESINSACTIKIYKDDQVYDKILNLFDADLSHQGEGSLQDIKNDLFDTVMPIPYWAWIDQSKNITQFLSKIVDKDNVKFAWPLLKDNISKCHAYISSDRIEILPEIVPIKKFDVFYTAKHRILMSATTQEDSLFIKDLDFSINAVKNPIVDNECSWAGEKMILIPTLMDLSISEDKLLSYILVTPHERAGIVILTPSSKKTEKYVEMGSIWANKPHTNIYEIIKKYKTSDYKKSTLVLANRYDGIDLSDDSCRLLIIDSLPYYDSLNDRYEELCRSSSDIIKIKLAQKIEQALGRSVRGEKDFSVIMIVGSNLVNFLQTSSNRKYFSLQTQQQIKIGFDIIDMCKEESEKIDVKSFMSIVNQCILRDQSWKEFYYNEMMKIEDSKINHNNNLYDILQKEKEAYRNFEIGNYENAKNDIQSIVDIISTDDEKGWYMQLMANYIYPFSKTDSEKFQMKAFNLNYQLLKPKHEIYYQKIKYEINDSRIKFIKKALNNYATTQDFMLEVYELLDNLNFSINHEKFEEAIKKLGCLLGFISERPDKELRKGPDNLWCIGENKYILIECKNQVRTTRREINKKEAGQMEEHCAWFNEEYNKEADYYILIIPTNKMANDAYFSHNVRIITTSKLEMLKRDLRQYFNEYLKYKINSLTDEQIQSFLYSHNLFSDNFFDNYLVNPER